MDNSLIKDFNYWTHCRRRREPTPFSTFSFFVTRHIKDSIRTKRRSLPL